VPGDEIVSSSQNRLLTSSICYTTTKCNHHLKLRRDLQKYLHILLTEFQQI
jgi:hypothetical protein